MTFLLNKHRFLFLFLLLCFLFTKKTTAQAYNFSVTNSPGCFSGSAYTQTAQVTPGFPSSITNFNWAVTGPSGCIATSTLTPSTGSIVNITFPCCGTYTIDCFAMNGSTLFGTLTNTYLAACSPSVSISGNTVICQGSTAVLTASGATFYNWSNGSSSSTISVSPSTTSNYTVYGIVGSCTVPAVQTVSVLPLPPVTIPTVNPLCAGASTFLTASGANSYTWVGGPINSSLVISPTISTTYTVLGSNGTCVNTATQAVIVIPFPIITISPGTASVCLGSSLTLIASGAGSYTWTNGPLSATNTISPIVSGTYTVTGANALLCYSSAIKTVTVYITPTITVTPFTATICNPGSVLLTASGAQSYTWNTGSQGNALVVSPTLTTNYMVSGANSAGCINTASVLVGVLPQVNPNFIFSYGLNGYVSFTNTSTNTNGNTTYSWNFNNGLTSSNVSPATTYTSNGVYTVSMTANSGCGNVTITHTLNITSIAGPCAASYSYIPGFTGTYTFVSTSVGTTTSTNYYWNFGNGNTYTATGLAGVNAVQTFTNGNYVVSLTITDTSSNCLSTYSANIGVCNAHATFTQTQTGINTINFVSTSTGTLPTTTYTWNYGDGATGTGTNVTHTYTSSGTYTISLTAINSSSCGASLSSPVSVTACNLSSNFSHTVGANGLVHFSNNSANTNTLTLFKWNFGDGVLSSAANPTHTYYNGGNYNVTLKILDSLGKFCSDSLTQSINITNVVCSANSNFTVTPSGTPLYWTATPSFPFNITSATWYWGDGQTDSTLYTSHTYSAAGLYSICLSVTVSCGSTSSYCYSYLLNKTADEAAQMVYINIAPPPFSTGISTLEEEEILFSIYPNPNTGTFNLSMNGSAGREITFSVYSLIGDVVYYSNEQMQEDHLNKTINLDKVNNGIYFIKVGSGNKTFTKKIIINR